MSGHGTALNVLCYTGRLDEAVDAVVTRALSGRGGYACLGNVHLLVLSRHDARVHQALENSWVVFPDGAPVAWLLRRHGAESAERIAGADLMSLVVERGERFGLRHYLFGSTAHVLEHLRRRLIEQSPRAEIVGAFAPPVGSTHGDDVITHLKTIREARPHIVWCALGAPKQELWMQGHASGLAPALTLGVGAAFDFLAATKPRAPLVFQRLGLEWLHRLISEPRRLGWRYARTNPEFLLVAALELLNLRVRTQVKRA